MILWSLGTARVWHKDGLEFLYILGTLLPDAMALKHCSFSKGLPYYFGHDPMQATEQRGDLGATRSVQFHIKSLLDTHLPGDGYPRCMALKEGQ